MILSTVRARMIAALTVFTVLLITVGVIGSRSTAAIDDDLNEMYSNRLEPVHWIGSLYVKQTQNMQVLDHAGFVRTPEAVREARTTRERNVQAIDALATQWAERLKTEKGRELHRAYLAKLATLRAANGELQSALEAGNWDLAASIRRERSAPALAELSTVLEEVVAQQFEQAEKLKESSAQSYRSTRWISVASILLGSALGLGLGFFVLRDLLRGLASATELSRRIGAGELGHGTVVTRNDEFGELLRSMTDMDARLCEVILNVRAAAESSSTASEQLSEGNDSLSQRTQEQAAALEETASSMEEMTSTVKQNADNARQANQLATSARGNAENGGTVVHNAIDAMREINVSSNKIADIIGVIDEIAFQTNLLALNAAVEAARAGEQGRGFAVVASEVRNLAQRSASAAKEIKALISDSVTKVNAGADLVNQSGKTLSEIIEGIKKVSDIVAEISAASDEQSSGIEQVNNAVTQMDMTTQQNAALVEEAAAASKSMQQQLHSLINAVAFFKVHSTAGLRHSTAPVTATPASSNVIAHPVRAASARSVRKTPRPVSQAPLAKASGDDSAWKEF